MITYETICKKLGFDLIQDDIVFPISDHEDDSQISPFSVLNQEELDFLTDYLIRNRSKLEKYMIR